MLVNPFCRSLAVVLLWLLSLVAAQESSITVLWDDAQNTVDEKTMVECGGHISQCGIMEDVKIIRSPVSTIYVTQNFTTTTEKILPTQTIVIRSVKVVTVNNQTQGHCRETMTVPEMKPAIITVNVTVEHVREIVPVTNVVSVETSTVTATSIEQCFVNNPDRSFHPPVSVSQDPPPVGIPVQKPMVHTDGLPDPQGGTQDIRHERIYQKVAEDVSVENEGFIFQGD
ncbi:hypothetical protein FHETE_11267 [Fusarium heterosporum]|uniref:Uncharacterized protein n=1 Tax=Fusarium heterosporum TaxID=42747 RepID=A0A8H5WA02_FUSHE|nr:hypothetical protein FHETE_11267 [Fusarium heterosporum]